MTNAEDALRHLRVIAAVPRPAGGRLEREARDYCARVLREYGFSVKEEPFEFSAFPGRYATPLAGILAIAGMLLAWRAGSRGAGGEALFILAAFGAAITFSAMWLARRGVLSLPILRERSVNLVAERGVPTIWIVAHLDSKSQVVPIGLRAVAISVTVAIWLIATLMGIAQVWDGAENLRAVWPWIAGAGIMSSTPVALTFVGQRSRGALDNASGVSALLLTVSLLPRDKPLGVLITSAEELGLAGARAWTSKRPAGTALNFDGLDDVGKIRLMWSGRKPGHLLEVLVDAAAEQGMIARTSRLLPGILVDGVALADASWNAVTISKVTLDSVARIHTNRDTMDHLTGDGIAAAARLAATALKKVT